jgi:UDP-N-acetylmuramoylalanine--D-glutamate ligase
MILILGAGESGIGAALLAKKYSIPVFVSDCNTIRPSFLQELIDNEIDFEQGSHTLAFDMNPEFIIKSPGIPDQSEIVESYKLKGTRIISEVEFAYQYCKGFIIAITGSNGKTTTTNLIYHILNQAGLDVVKAGNVGLSFSRAVSQKNWTYYVLELSSFQLDGIDTFKSNISVLLNITPDHLDRYKQNFELYTESKFRITKNQTAEHHFIYYNNDKVIRNYIKTHQLKANLISLNPELDDNDVVRIDGEVFADLSKSCLKGKHNAVNASCAVQVAKLMNLSPEQISSSINSFINDPHRLELITSLNGVEFINDSKATNVDSVFWALDAMKKKIVWIAGGQDKGNNYSVLKPLVEEKVKAIICLGVDNTKLIKAFENIVPLIIDTHDLATAVRTAYDTADGGDVVLLSPACASFDLFLNYEDRGTQFRHEVLKLK